MKDYKILEIKKSVFEDNDREADELRKALKMQKTFLLNLMSSPGSGKTTTLKKTIDMLKDEMKIGVMEADIDSDVDAAAAGSCKNSAPRTIHARPGQTAHAAKTVAALPANAAPHSAAAAHRRSFCMAHTPLYQNFMRFFWFL